MPNFETAPTAAALEGLRILDLSGPMGNYCGKMFADMGADVILVEPPGGSGLRFEPPFIGDIPGTERSLNFAYQWLQFAFCLSQDTNCYLEHPWKSLVLMNQKVISWDCLN